MVEQQRVKVNNNPVQPVKGLTFVSNMLLYGSRSTKPIVVAELTVPWEKKLDVSHQLKKPKYQDLAHEVVLKVWYASIFLIEVGYFLQKIGLEPKHLKKATMDRAATAVSSSREPIVGTLQQVKPS